MPTLGDLIENTRHLLSGLDASKDAVSALSKPIDATTVTIPLEDVGSASIGLAEIDFELIRVKSVQTADATMTAWPFGRGYRSTRAISHNPGAEVRFNPAWPTSTIAREINGVLTDIYPTVYAVQTAITTIPALGSPVQIPGEAIGVVSVFVEDDARPDVWVREDRWGFNPDSSDIGCGLWVGGHYRQGQRVRVVYAARPELFDLNGATDQDFALTTLLDNRVSDLIALGVAHRLTPFIDVSKLPYVSAVAADDTSGNKSAGQAGTTARLLHSLYQARLADEAARLKNEHPIRVHRTR